MGWRLRTCRPRCRPCSPRPGRRSVRSRPAPMCLISVMVTPRCGPGSVRSARSTTWRRPSSKTMTMAPIWPGSRSCAACVTRWPGRVCAVPDEDSVPAGRVPGRRRLGVGVLAGHRRDQLDRAPGLATRRHVGVFRLHHPGLRHHGHRQPRPKPHHPQDRAGGTGHRPGGCVGVGHSRACLAVGGAAQQTAQGVRQGIRRPRAEHDVGVADLSPAQRGCGLRRGA